VAAARAAIPTVHRVIESVDDRIDHPHAVERARR
jgi:hypothetical protein